MTNALCLFLPNDHIVGVDQASQGAVFNGEAITDDDAGSAFKAVEKHAKIHMVKRINHHSPEKIWNLYFETEQSSTVTLTETQLTDLRWHTLLCWLAPDSSQLLQEPSAAAVLEGK